MKCFVFFCSVLLTIFGFDVGDSIRTRAWNSRCPRVKLTHGRARLQGFGRILKLNCVYGFVLVGEKFVNCRNSKWVPDLPVCASTNCQRISEVKNGQIVEKYNGAILTFFCEPGYEMQGPSEIYCDGRTWNDTAPSCTTTKVNPPTRCNFENPGLCSWEQDPLHDFDWTRHSFNERSWAIGTGPTYDHTLGAGYDGYYLYIEATDELENSTARIVSPLYSSNLTEAGCFSFWYHMYGLTVGTLNVYFKAEGETDRRLMFTEKGNRGNHWRHGILNLPRENTSFQLIVEGVRGNGYLSEIAVDDFAILQGDECAPNLDTTTYITTTDDNDQVEIVNGMQSCFGRCTYSSLTDPNSLCQCNIFCMDNQNCCPDYPAYCILPVTDMTDSDDTAVTEAITSPSMTTKLSSTGPERLPIPINPKDDIDPNPPKIPEKPTDPPDITQSKITTTMMITTKKGPVTSSEANVPGTNMSTEKYQASKLDGSKVTLPGIIAIVFGITVGVAGSGLIAYLVLQKRNSYKNNSGTSALSEDSDVRFLTSDEMLDFNLARPEDMEM